MCGIAAFISSSNASQHFDWLSTTGYSLGHRGPDDTGYFYNSSKNVGLAHTRLSIQDTSALGAQPYHSKDKSIAIKVDILINKKKVELKNEKMLTAYSENIRSFFFSKKGANLLAKKCEKPTDPNPIPAIIIKSVKFGNRLLCLVNLFTLILRLSIA